MTVLRDLVDVATLPQMPLHQLPGETVQSFGEGFNKLVFYN